MENNQFDTIAPSYRQSILPWMKITGESLEFYARCRIQWTSRKLKAQGIRPKRIMDFGCGVGGAIPFLQEEFGASTEIIGVDVSRNSLELAASKYASDRVTFEYLDHHSPKQNLDLVYCNGVFHHLHGSERDVAAKYVRDCLRPDGYFALWENNPWNPLMRYNMSHAEIDKDAEPIPAISGRKIVTRNGFDLISTEHLFIFPALLGFLRPLESLARSIPIGAQYVLFSRK
jgi:SAM-dependent methyltransferase